MRIPDSDPSAPPPVGTSPLSSLGRSRFGLWTRSTRAGCQSLQATLFGVALAFCLSLPGLAQQSPAPDAYLDLDTGGHRAVIRALAASAISGKVWSAGDDKVIREWSLGSGKAGQILRGQIGPGNEGTINALAVSGNGAYLAAAGYFAPHLSLGTSYGDVRIYETSSGKITSVLKGFDWVVTTLAYDSVTDVLAVSGQGGIVHRWKAPFSASPQRLTDFDSQASRVMALTYLEAGRVLAVATLDYGLHMFDTATGGEITIDDPEPLWETPVLALAAAPDGKSFALAAEDGTLQIRSSRGTLLPSPEAMPFRPDALVWTSQPAQAPPGTGAPHSASDQDQFLTVACGYRCGTEHGMVSFRAPTDLHEAGALWQEVGRSAQLRPIRAAVAGARPGEIILAGGEVPSVAILTGDDPSGALPSAVPMVGIGRPISAVAISADGTRIAWGTDDPCPELTICPEVLGNLSYAMQLPSPELSATPPKPLSAPPSDLLRAVLEAGGVSLSTGRAAESSFDGSQLRIDGPVGSLAITRSDIDGAYISAMGLIPSRDEVITGGGNGILLAQSLEDGRVIGEFIGHTADVLALSAAPAAGRLISGGADQTLRIWDLASRRLVASLFAAQGEWILWTPEGYYHSSPEGDQLIGWHLNQGPDKEARYITARQLRQHLHSPEIVRRALLIGDASAAAIELRGTDTELAELLTRPAPEFTLAIRSDLPSPEGTVIIEVAGASLEEMEDWGFAILVNDRRVPAQRIPDSLIVEPPPSEITPPYAAPLPPELATRPPEIAAPQPEPVAPGRRGGRRGSGSGSSASPAPPQPVTDPPGTASPGSPDPGTAPAEVAAPKDAAPSLDPSAKKLARFFYQIPVENGENSVLVTGENDFGYVTERSGMALFRAPQAEVQPGRLFVAVIGINRYPQLADCGGRSCELAFPVADAIGFLRTVKTFSAPLFSTIETLVIANPEDLEAVGAQDVIDPASVLPPEGKIITEQLIEFLAKPGPEDTTIIFVASHGVNLGEDFFIVPSDAQKRGEEFRKSSLVDWSVIQEEIGFATGRRILMLDTCHAANAFNAKLEKDAADARVIVFSATAANNTAQEKRGLGHGIFTYSVIQGLSGAASDGSGVRLLGLADFIYREVVRLSDGRQEPFYHISQTANFLLSKG